MDITNNKARVERTNYSRRYQEVWIRSTYTTCSQKKHHKRKLEEDHKKNIEQRDSEKLKKIGVRWIGGTDVPVKNCNQGIVSVQYRQISGRVKHIKKKTKFRISYQIIYSL